MATIKEIRDQRDAALKTLRDKRKEAIAHRTAGVVGMQQIITDISDQIDQVHDAAVIAAGNSEQLKQALKILTDATKELVDKAAEMKTATDFLNKAAELITKAKGVVDAIKDGAKKVGGGS